MKKNTKSKKNTNTEVKKMQNKLNSTVNPYVSGISGKLRRISTNISVFFNLATQQDRHWSTWTITQNYTQEKQSHSMRWGMHRHMDYISIHISTRDANFTVQSSAVYVNLKKRPTMCIFLIGRRDYWKRYQGDDFGLNRGAIPEQRQRSMTPLITHLRCLPFLLSQEI